jgi:hypothetical protein
MTTPNSLPQPSEVVEAVEEFFDALPPKKQRRTRSQIQIDQAPESENYGLPVAPPIVIELDADAQTELPWLLHRLGRARNDAVAQIITAKIYDLLGVELEGGE